MTSLLAPLFEQPNELPSMRARVLATFILCLFAFATLWDRYATAGVLQSIEEYYDVDDTLGGLLQLAFVVASIFAALVLGWAGDRMNRRWLLLISCWLWFVFSAAASFIPANMFWIFMLSRSLAAVGEAAISTFGPAMMADYFSGKARNYSIMAFYICYTLGITFSIIVGTVLVDATVPWQWALRIAPIFGLPTIVLCQLFLQEPPRGASDGERIEEHDKGNVLRDTFDIFRTKSVTLIIIATACKNFYTRAYAWFGTSLALNAMNYLGNDTSTVWHGLSYSSVSGIMGMLSMVAALTGAGALVFVARLWRDRGFPCCARGGSKRGPALAVAIATTVSIPFFFLLGSSMTWDVYLGVVGAWFAPFLSSGSSPVLVEMMMTVLSPDRRSRANALSHVVQCITGDGPAPFITGALSVAFRDALQENGDAYAKYFGLVYALNIGLVISTFGSGLFFIVGWFYPKDISDREAFVALQAKMRGRKAADHSATDYSSFASSVNLSETSED